MVIGALFGKRLIGMVGVYREPMIKLAHKANVWGMYVSPPARRSGVGRRLVDEALAFAARGFGVQQVNLGVNASNTAVIGLYKQLGFEQFGLERRFMLLDGAPQDEMHMVCTLASARTKLSIEAAS